MNNYLIRPPTEEDLDAFYNAFDIVANEQKYFSFTSAPPKDKLNKYLSKVISQGLPFLVLEINGRFKGWAEATPLSGQSAMHNGMLSIALLPETRGLKMGSVLAKSIIESSKKFGFIYLRADVFSENKRAIKLYKSLGFQIDGERNDYFKLTDRSLDLTLMTLKL